MTITLGILGVWRQLSDVFYDCALCGYTITIWRPWVSIWQDISGKNLIIMDWSGYGAQYCLTIGIAICFVSKMFVWVASATFNLLLVLSFILRRRATSVGRGAMLCSFRCCTARARHGIALICSYDQNSTTDMYYT